MTDPDRPRTPEMAELNLLQFGVYPKPPAKISKGISPAFMSGSLHKRRVQRDRRRAFRFRLWRFDEIADPVRFIKNSASELPSTYLEEQELRLQY
jgi:hypothetical protein